MDVSLVTRWFSLAALLLSGAMFGVAGVSFVTAGALPQAFFIAAIITGSVGGTFYVTSLHSAPSRIIAGGMREMVLVLLIFWMVMPCFAGLPFFFAGASFLDAWFEAVSAVTTTGAWLNGEAAREDQAGLVWRAMLQWGGGLVSLAAAAAIFIRPEFIGMDTTQAPFARGESMSYLRAFEAGLAAFAPLYGILTLLFIVVFIALSVRPVEAIALSMSLLSSGGFIPATEGLVGYSPQILLPVLLAMTLSASNFLILARMTRRQHGNARLGEDHELAVFAVLIPAVGIILWVSTGAEGLSTLAHQIFNSVSYFSTNGITYGDPPAIPIILVTAVIGGAAVSTAGGLKVLRWMVTFRRAGLELWKLSNPHAVPRQKESSQELGVWIHFICFTVFLAFLVLAVTLFGHNLEMGMATAVAVISNAGPIAAVTAEGSSDFEIFHPVLRFSLALGMIFGRLEMVIALAALNLAFWRS